MPNVLGGGKDSVIVIHPRPTLKPSVSLEPPPAPYQRRLEFDSAGNVTVHDELLGADATIPQTYTPDQFVLQGMDDRTESGLLKSAQNNTSASAGTSSAKNQGGAGGKKDETPGILSDYGQIEIPIPPSIVPTIFGKPSINLRVNGDVAIHLAYRDNQFLQTTGTLFSGSETGIDFRQEVNMNISGSIGDKVKINTDFGSLRQFSFDNLFKLSYQGYPYEIIQSVEAGNISLTTPSKYIGIQSGLFGFKGVMRFGPWYLTAVAAQKKAERQTKTFGGGPGSSSGTDFTIQPANYRKNVYFLDTAYIPLFEKVYSTIPTQGTADIVIPGTVELWRSVSTTDQQKTVAYAHYDLKQLPAGSATYGISYHQAGTKEDSISAGYVRKVDTSQYRLDPKTGIIILYQEPSDYDFYAVSYRTPTGQVGEQIGTANDTAYVLKLLKPRRLTPADPSWKNLLKNTYYVGATNIDQKNFSVRVAYTFPTGQSYEFVRSATGLDKAISVMGLDRYNNATNTREADGLFDVISNGAVSPLLDSRSGTLIFPYLQPFGQRILDYQAEQKRKNPKYKADSTFYFPEIYTQQSSYFNYNSSKNTQIAINVKYAGGTSTIINLNAFNIVEGSVRVTAGGRQLVEGTDYRVDINSGTITLLKPELATAGQISVDYDTHDIFTTSTKTLLGLRGELPLGDRGLFGLSLFNYSMHLPTIKTRQGEEPLSNWILGSDFSYKVPFPSLTNWLNAIPIFNLRDKSEISFKLDGALSLPNPNTQESPMAVDNGASIAYLDDFEGGRNEFPLYMSYGRWVHASQPQDYANYVGQTRSQINTKKAKTYWYEAYPQDVRITDIKPNKSVATPNEFAQVLDVVYDPQNPKGIYNHSPDLGANASDRWGGMMQYLQGLNVQATNTDAIEFWMNIQEDGGQPLDGVIHFDMGRISEDVIPDDSLETEDKNNNGHYDPGEDVGLDGYTNDQEKTAIPGAYNPDDPSNDNYSYTQNSGNYEEVNGTEGNEQDRSSGLIPDTEDLDGNSVVNLDNSYYEYDIPITTSSNPYIIGNTDGKWFQFRIPINDFKRMVGNLDSSFSNISYYRMWFTGFSKRLHVRFYDIGLAGSQWTRARTGLNPNNPIGDTSFAVNYVNIEDNAGAPTNYTSPPGAERDRLAGQAAVVLGNEQSITLQIKCIPDGTKREATRVFPSPNDLFNYRSMAIWVHGDQTMPTTLNSPTDTIGKTWIYFRFGTDQYNYYEYRRPLTRDWSNIHVDFATLAALKASKVRSTDVLTAPANDGFIGSEYTVIGSPNITNAPVFTLGVENRTGSNCLQTEVWFDELRLLDANDRSDYALNGNVQMKLAEFGTLTTNFLYERPDFHRVDERFNSLRSLNSGWGLTAELQMQKVLPSWLERGTKIPLVLAHSELLNSPKYLPNTDVEVSSALDKIQERANSGQLDAGIAQHLQDSIRLVSQTLTIRNSIGLAGVQFNFPGSFFLLPSFVNRLILGFGYGEEFTRSPIYDYYRNWSWTASVLYDLPTLPNVSVSPLTWINPSTFDVGRYSLYKINFLPQRLTLGASFTRSRLHYLNRSSTLVFPPLADIEDSLEIIRSLVPFITRSDSAVRSFAFTWKLTENGLISPQIEFNLNAVSNLTPLETYTRPNTPVYLDNSGKPVYAYDSVYYYQRPFKDVLGDVFFKDGALVRPGKDFLVNQRFKLTTSPRLPWLLWIDKYIRPVFNYVVDYHWYDAQSGAQNDRTGQWNNTITTGLEFNLRDLGNDIFGSDVLGAGGNNQQAPRRGARAAANTGLSMGGSQDLSAPNVVQKADEPFGGVVDEGPIAGKPNIRRVDPKSKVSPPTAVDTIKKRQPSFGTPQGVDTLAHSPGVGAEGIHDDLSSSDTLLLPKAPPEQPKEEIVEEPGVTLRDLSKALIQKPFFDWNGTKFNFIQTNFSLNGALQGGGSGISNLLTKGIFSPEEDAIGPSRAYQLGLITDPHGRLLIKFIPKFPFVEFGVRHGLRQSTIPGQSVDINDVFTQKNTFELQTSRPLWSGATINLNWKTEFTYDERDALRIHDDGSIEPLTTQKTGDISRTFLSIPPLPFINVTQSSIKRVGEKWIEKSSNAGYTTDIERDTMPAVLKNQLQVESFMEGFETLPFFTGILREYLPRLNYSFTWSGLEKFPIFSFADHATFRHGYTGNYKRQFKLNAGDSVQLTTLQTVTYAFRPLIALDLTWDKIWGGRLNASLNYDTQTDWSSDYSFNRITSRLSTTFGINANFQKSGLSIPFLKLNLKNNFGATFNFSQTISSDIYYTFNTILTNPGGTSNGGVTKTIVEPRFSYDINQQLTIEGFYRYERTTPTSSVILAPPTRTITAGFDIRLKVF